MIDTKRLATDAAYWRECGAPEDATHYEPGEQDPECWAKIVGGRIMHWSPVEEWHVWNPKGMDGKFIPRPEPRQMEWPESGSKWEHHSGRVYAVIGIANGKTERPEQYPVTVIYQNVDNGTLWSRPLNDWARSFKPYRSKEQRQREELEDDLSGILPFCEYSPEQIKEMAQILYTQGYRKP